VVAANPGFGGTARPDGRLRGEDFTATVTKVAWPQSVTGSNGAPLVAGSGDRLVVFSLALTQAQEDAGVLGGPTAVNRLPLMLERDSRPSPWRPSISRSKAGASATALTTGPRASPPPYGAPAPRRTGADRGRVLPVPQPVTMQRVPPIPAILYRDPRSANVVGQARALCS